ncbi:MAG: LTA synthase family protein [Gammaproteobacteria bacterium]
MTLLLLSFGCAVVSLLGETCLLKPASPLNKRGSAALLVHVGMFLLVFNLLFLFSGRPLSALCIVIGLHALLVAVNNAKYQALQEPLVFSDLLEFAQVFKHPRLYLPFLGWSGLLTLLLLPPALIYAALYLEKRDTSGWVIALLSLAISVLMLLSAKKQPFDIDANVNLRKQGLLASLVVGQLLARQKHCRAEFENVLQQSVFADPSNTLCVEDVIVIQSESFFDVRRLYAPVAAHILQHFDSINAEAHYLGQLDVDAWGANTMRSEFAFLTAVPNKRLGCYRFYPYPYLKTPLPSLARYFRERGYRTICLHPHAATFFQRDRVFPLLGFDEFIDIENFSRHDKVGPYISDAAVTEKILALRQQSTQPLFIFAITMENHGPLHLESIGREEQLVLYRTLPSFDAHNLSVYLRHLQNADRMIDILTKRLREMDRGCWLCFYGDHVPIIPAAYTALNFNNSQSDYFIWHNRKAATPQRRTLAVDELSALLARLVDSGPTNL